MSKVFSYFPTKFLVIHGFQTKAKSFYNCTSSEKEFVASKRVLTNNKKNIEIRDASEKKN